MVGHAVCAVWLGHITNLSISSQHLSFLLMLFCFLIIIFIFIFYVFDNTDKSLHTHIQYFSIMYWETVEFSISCIFYSLIIVGGTITLLLLFLEYILIYTHTWIAGLNFIDEKNEIKHGGVPKKCFFGWSCIEEKVYLYCLHSSHVSKGLLATWYGLIFMDLVYWCREDCMYNYLFFFHFFFIYYFWERRQCL